jgi:hypothetical protein
MGERTRRFRRLVTTASQADNDQEMAALLREMLADGQLVLGRPRKRDAFARIQRALLDCNRGPWDGDQRLATALSDLGLSGSQQ